MDYNSLTGSLDGVFNSSTQKFLQVIQVNINYLTGTIPGDIFIAARLVTFIASVNCFHGTLPISVCNASSLLSLVFNGLGTASSCRTELFPGLSTSYISMQHVHGSIPDCLFQLRNITTLYVSGNAFSGNIVNDDLVISSSLTDLVLSHNRLTGVVEGPLQIDIGLYWIYLSISSLARCWTVFTLLETIP